MTPTRELRLLSRDTHTTALPGDVMQRALHLLASGSLSQRLQAAQLLASAYAEDEERRVAAEE